MKILNPIYFYNNEFINRKDLMFKRQLLIMNVDEKPEQNIEIEQGDKEIIIIFVSDYHNKLFNLSIVFNNPDNLIPIKNNIIVKLKFTQFLISNSY